MLRRRLKADLAVLDQGDPEQLRLSCFPALTDETIVDEYAVLVTSLTHEILSVAQLYRDRADAENPFDELKNHWGWGGFTTQDIKRCRVMARITRLDLSLVEPVRAPGRPDSAHRGDSPAARCCSAPRHA